MANDKNWHGVSVLITGATGFLGAHLAARLDREGAQLSLLLRPGRRRTRVPGRPELPEGATRIMADLVDGPALAAALRGAAFARVFHLAACTDLRRDPELKKRCQAVNREGTRNLVRALETSAVQRFIHFGTCEEYGGNQAPFAEDAVLDPVSPYSESKAEASCFLLQRIKEQGYPAVILRPFLAYGEGQDPGRFLAQAIAAALTDQPLDMTLGTQTREFNHLEDHLEGILRAGLAPGIEGEIINLACGDERSIKEVAELVFRLAGSRAAPNPGALPFREGENQRFFGSTEKCRRLLGDWPRIPLEEGLARLIRQERTRRKAGNHG